jgi:hypothetical protein
MPVAERKIHRWVDGERGAAGLVEQAHERAA